MGRKLNIAIVLVAMAAVIVTSPDVVSKQTGWKWPHTVSRKAKSGYSKQVEPFITRNIKPLITSIANEYPKFERQVARSIDKFTKGTAEKADYLVLLQVLLFIAFQAIVTAIFILTCCDTGGKSSKSNRSSGSSGKIGAGGKWTGQQDEHGIAPSESFFPEGAENYM